MENQLFGVGPGNVPCYINKSAKLKTSVNDLVLSKAFDNGMICASEQAVLVDREVYQEFEKLMKEAGCYFVNPEEIIIADMVQIKRVVMNLLSNGIKYAIKNSKLIININIESGVLKFSVESNSPYISEAKQKNIFAKYITYAATNKELGCGLGLYTSKKIIEAHNGKVALKSFKDNRNIFSFEIPQKQNLNRKPQKISL